MIEIGNWCKRIDPDLQVLRLVVLSVMMSICGAIGVKEEGGEGGAGGKHCLKCIIRRNHIPYCYITHCRLKLEAQNFI